ncbi:MAG: hypothetical protein ACLUOF_07820 [Ruminococcus sp.]
MVFLVVAVVFPVVVVVVPFVVAVVTTAPPLTPSMLESTEPVL